VSQLCFRLGIEEQVCRTNALQNHSHRSAMRDRNREGRREHTQCRVAHLKEADDDARTKRAYALASN
jgi:hypothetical protein